MRWDIYLIFGIYAISAAFLVMANIAPSGEEVYKDPYSGTHLFLISLSIGIWTIGVPVAAVLGINGLVKLVAIRRRKFLFGSVYVAALLLGPLMMIVPH